MAAVRRSDGLMADMAAMFRATHFAHRRITFGPNFYRCSFTARQPLITRAASL